MLWAYIPIQLRFYAKYSKNRKIFSELYKVYWFAKTEWPTEIAICSVFKVTVYSSSLKIWDEKKHLTVYSISLFIKNRVATGNLKLYISVAKCYKNWTKESILLTPKIVNYTLIYSKQGYASKNWVEGLSDEAFYPWESPKKIRLTFATEQNKVLIHW